MSENHPNPPWPYATVQHAPPPYPPPAPYPYPIAGPPGAARPASGSSPNDPVHWLIPTGRSWQSLVAGYLGLFTIVFWFLGPIAIGFGIWALHRAAREGTHGRGRAIFGLITGALSTIALLAVILTP